MFAVRVLVPETRSAARLSREAVIPVGTVIVEVAEVPVRTTISGAPAFTETAAAKEISLVTTTANEDVAIFCFASTALQLMVVVPIANLVPEDGEQSTPTAPFARSVADGDMYEISAPNTLAAGALTVSCAAITGAVVSLIVTDEVAVALFPAPSRAVHETTVVPTLKEVGAYESAMVVVETASVVEARVRVGAASGVRGAVASKLCADGTVIAGAVVSVMFTAKVVVAVFPAISVLVQIIVVAPSANCNPDRGEHETAVVPSTASVALGAVYIPSAPAVEVASIVTASCAAITGAVLSMLVTVIVVVATLPAASVATKLKLPFAVKRRDEALSVPSLALALTVIS